MHSEFSRAGKSEWNDQMVIHFEINDRWVFNYLLKFFQTEFHFLSYKFLCLSIKCFFGNETCINFMALLISQDAHLTEKFQVDVGSRNPKRGGREEDRERERERERERTGKLSVLFSLAEAVYSRDKHETGCYIRSILSQTCWVHVSRKTPTLNWWQIPGRNWWKMETRISVARWFSRSTLS